MYGLQASGQSLSALHLNGPLIFLAQLMPGELQMHRKWKPSRPNILLMAMS